MTPKVSALILAAGAGTRFGFPKALAVTEGRSWLSLAVSKCDQSGYDPICIVVGCRAAQIRADCVLDACAATVIWSNNAAWERGRTGSIICGLGALEEYDGQIEGTLVYPVDFPFVGVETVAALRDAYAASAQRRESIVVPFCDHRNGHPILVGKDVCSEIRLLGADQPLHEVVHRDPSRLVVVPVADGGIHRDINRPEELTEHD